MVESLVEALKQREPDCLLWVIGEERLTVGEVLAKVKVWREAHDRFRGRSVRVGRMTSAELALVLCGLDGWASELRLEWDGKVVGLEMGLEEVGGNRELPSGEQTRWLLPTSGTATGVPTWVTHNFSTLTREVKVSSTKGVEWVWGLVYDLRRFAGLQVFLQAMLGGGALAILPEREADQIGVEQLLCGLRDAGVNALSATPTQWRWMLAAESMKALPLGLVTLGGEAVDQRLLDELGERFPLARLTHIYASTELGVGFSVSDGISGFPRSFLKGAVPEGRAWRLNEASELERWDSDRKIWQGTGDLVRCEGGRCYFRGRKDGQINVGGVNVVPEEVESVALETAGVSMARARGRRNVVTGEVVELLIVSALPTGEASLLEKRVVALCEKRLPRHAVPAVVNVVDVLPMTGTGKMRRI